MPKRSAAAAAYPVSESALAQRQRLWGDDPGSIVYEVNCEVDADIAADFYAWLKPHVQQLVAIEECGFMSGEILEPESVDSAKKLFVVLYPLKDRAGLQQYLDVHAAKLRGDGLRFADKLSITRRIMKSNHSLSRREALAAGASDHSEDP